MDNEEIRKRLARFGITDQLDSGSLTLTSQRGVVAVYSGLSSCDVVGLGADGCLSVSMARDGDAFVHFRADGKTLKLSKHDPSRRLSIPKGGGTDD